MLQNGHINTTLYLWFGYLFTWAIMKLEWYKQYANSNVTIAEKKFLLLLFVKFSLQEQRINLGFICPEFSITLFRLF